MRKEILSETFNKMVGEPFNEGAFIKAAEQDGFKKYRIIGPGRARGYDFDPERLNIIVNSSYKVSGFNFG